MSTMQLIATFGGALLAQLGVVCALCWYVRRDNDRVVDAICKKTESDIEAAIHEHQEGCEARLRESSQRFRLT